MYLKLEQKTFYPRESGANVFCQSVYKSGSVILIPIENAARFPTYPNRSTVSMRSCLVWTPVFW